MNVAWCRLKDNGSLFCEECIRKMDRNYIRETRISLRATRILKTEKKCRVCGKFPKWSKNETCEIEELKDAVVQFGLRPSYITKIQISERVRKPKINKASPGYIRTMTNMNSKFYEEKIKKILQEELDKEPINITPSVVNIEEPEVKSEIKTEEIIIPDTKEMEVDEMGNEESDENYSDLNGIEDLMEIEMICEREEVFTPQPLDLRKMNKEIKNENIEDSDQELIEIEEIQNIKTTLKEECENPTPAVAQLQRYVSSIFEFIDQADSPINYRSEAARKASFKDWKCPYFTPEHMAAEGFYYTGQIDKVRCYECRVEICRWEATDNLRQEHLKWGGRCKHIVGPSRNIPIIKKEEQQEGMDICGIFNEEEISNEQKCKICCNRELEIMFMDCGHIFCCRQCAMFLEECPVCSKRIVNMKRAYIV